MSTTDKIRFCTYQNELLLICCRTQLNESQIKQIRHLIVEGDIDWKTLLETSDFHRTTPLLYKSLKHCSDLPPPEVSEKLTFFYKANCSKNLLFLGTLLKIAHLLERHSIPAVPFKGPVLTEQVFGNLCLRSFGDLDILISKSNLEQVLKLSLENGYRLDLNLPLQTYLKLVDKGHHANLVHTGNGVTVELHWELTGCYTGRAMDMSLIQPRLDSITSQNHELLTIGNEDLLVYLCIHGNRHRWEQLDAVCCVAELVRKAEDFDWNFVFSRAKELGVVRIVSLGLLLAEKLLELEITSTMIKNIEKNPELEKIVEEVAEGLMNPQSIIQAERYHVDGVRYHYQTLDRKIDGIRYGIRKFCIPDINDLQWFPLPSPLWFLYIVIRPLRFFIEYSKKLFKRIIQNQQKQT